jgi:hypothetical protein
MSLQDNLHELAMEHLRLSRPSPADLLAAVRAAVEDGTIEGTAINVHRLQADSSLDAPLLQAPKAGTYLVIPLSDGGSET